MSAKRHVLICGTGRAGTTLLVRILAKAGLETGFDERHFEEVENAVGRAGLEVPLNRKGELPTVIKSPHAVDTLQTALKGNLDIALAIVPMRNLWEAAESRRRVQKAADEKGLERAPGGLWKTNSPDRQEEVLALQFYKTVRQLVIGGIPIVFLDFPRFAQEVSYFADALGPSLQTAFCVERDDLIAAHMAESKTELVTVR